MAFIKLKKRKTLNNLNKMKKTIIIAVLAFGMNVTAQTLPQVASNTKNITSSVLWPGTTYSMNNTNVDGRLSVGNVRTNSIYMDTANGSSIQLGGANAFIGSSFEVAVNQSTTLGGSLSVRNGSSLNGINNNNAGITNAGLITQVTAGAVNSGSLQAINGSQLHATNTSVSNLATTVSNNATTAANATASVQANLDITNGNLSNLATLVDTKVSQTDFNNLSYSVSVNTNDITDIQNTKADKAQVQLDIAQAKADANAYTDTKVGALETKVNNEVTRLDKRIDATNTTVENNKVEAAKATAKVQSNLDIESAARKKADEEIYGSINKTNANLDKEIATRKLEVARLDNRIDNVINYVGNEFKAVNNRIDGLGAMTVALSTAATSSVYNPNKPTNVNFATGYYGRAGALALGVSHFLSSNTKLSVNYAAGSFTKSAVGLGVGFAF